MKIKTLLLSCTFLAAANPAFAETFTVTQDEVWTEDKNFSDNGTSAYGIMVNGVANSWTITTDGNITSDNNFRGIYAYNGGKLSIVGNNNTLQSNGNTNASGIGGRAIYAQNAGSSINITNMNIQMDGNSDGGLAAHTGGTITVKGNGSNTLYITNTVNDEYTGGHGIMANSLNTVDGQSTINIEDMDIFIVNTERNGAATYSGGLLKIKGNGNTLFFDNITAWAITSTLGSTVDISGMNIYGNTKETGFVSSFDNSELKLTNSTLNALNNTALYGGGENAKITINNSTIKSGVNKLMVAETYINKNGQPQNPSYWTYENTNATLDVSNNSKLYGSINVIETDKNSLVFNITDSSWSNIGQSNITNYTASNANIYLNRGDLLTVEGASSGDTMLHISPNYGLLTAPVLVVDQSSAASADAVFSLYGGVVDSGAYEFGLGKDVENNNWYLRSNGVMSNGFRAFSSVPAVHYGVVKTGMNELRKRLGELRDNSPESKSGAWVRSFGKNLSVADSADFDLDLYGVEGGFDQMIYADCDNKIYAGIMAGYMNSDDLESGKNKGEINTPSIGAYAAWLNSDGWFADATVREFWVNTDLDTFTKSGSKISAKPDRDFTTASLEFGRQMSLDDFILEPKAEVSYLYSDKDSFKTNSGNELKYDETEGFSTRLGMLFGYKKELENGSVLRPFAEVAYVKEWSGTTDLTYAGAGHKSTLNGDGIELSIGLNAKVNNTFNLYGDVTYETGNVLESVAGNVGVRWSF